MKIWLVIIMVGMSTGKRVTVEQPYNSMAECVKQRDALLSEKPPKGISATARCMEGAK